MRRTPLLVGLGLAALVAVGLYLMSTPPAGDPSLPESDRVEAPEPEPEAPVIAAADREAVAAAPIEEPEVAPDQPPESYTRYLSGVTGRIVDVDGTPMPGMLVEALAATLDDFLIGKESLFDEEPPEFDEVKASDRTGDDGRFVFEGLEPRGIYVLGIDLGGPRATIRFVDQAPNPGQLVDLGDVRLDPYVVFLGRLIDDDGAPVASARVRATNLPSLIFSFGVQNLRPGFSVAFQEDLRAEWRVAPIPRWVTRLIDRFPVPTTHSADDGTFRLEGVPLGLVTVLADQPGLVSLVHGPVPSGNGGERNIGDLRMTAGETLTGRVVDYDDQPVVGASLMAGARVDIAPAALMVPLGPTDKDGRFSVAGFPDTDHVVAARKDGSADWSLVTDVVPGFDEALIRIGETWQVEVIVYDEQGALLPRPSLVLQRRDRLPLHPLLVPPIDLSQRLSYRDDGTAVIRDLDPGQYVVLAKAPGYAVGKAKVDLDAGPTGVEISLVPEIAATVDVVEQASGEPVHWATVSVYNPRAVEREMRRVSLMNRRTGEDGRAVLPGLEVGEYAFGVFHPGYAQEIVTATVPGETVVVQLKQGGSLKGRVVAGDRPPEEQRFITVARDNMPEFPRFTVTDENGEFEVTHLTPGNVQIIVMRRFADQGIGNLVGKVETFIPERFEQAAIREGEVTQVVIDVMGAGADGPTARLSGRLLLNGVAKSSMTVQYRPDGSWRAGKSAVTDSRGAFDLGEVKAGKGELTIRQPGDMGRFQFGRLAERDLELSPDENRELVIEVFTGHVEGRVLADRDNSPLAAAEVSLRTQEAGSEWADGVRMQTVSGRDGSFSFDVVPEGTYRLSARRNGFADVELKGLAVPARGAPPPVTMRLITGVEVRGRVELPSGTEPPRFLFVEFRREDDSGGRTGARVDADSGEFVVKGLLPGSYTARVRGRDLRLEGVPVEVPRQGLEGHVLRPQPESQKTEAAGGS